MLAPISNGVDTSKADKDLYNAFTFSAFSLSEENNSLTQSRR